MKLISIVRLIFAMQASTYEGPHTIESNLVTPGDSNFNINMQNSPDGVECDDNRLYYALRIKKSTPLCGSEGAAYPAKIYG